MNDFSPPNNETVYRKKLAKLEWHKLNSELKLTKPKLKGSQEKVEEMAIHRTMYYLWDKIIGFLENSKEKVLPIFTHLKLLMDKKKNT